MFVLPRKLNKYKYNRLCFLYFCSNIEKENERNDIDCPYLCVGTNVLSYQ